MKRFLGVGVLLVVAFALLSAGCYTVLKHPTGTDIVAEGSYYRSCADCHADASFYHPYGGNPYYRYGRSQYGWSDYYGYPWWYDDYWWWDGYDHHDHDEDGPGVEAGTRHLWNSDGWASGGWGFVKPGSSPRSTPPPQGEQRKEENKKDDKKKEEKKESKDERSIWTKPKKGF